MGISSAHSHGTHLLLPPQNCVSAGTVHCAPGALICPRPVGASHAGHRVVVGSSFLPHAPAETKPGRPVWMQPSKLGIEVGNVKNDGKSPPPGTCPALSLARRTLLAHPDSIPTLLISTSRNDDLGIRVRPVEGRSQSIAASSGMSLADIVAGERRRGKQKKRKNQRASERPASLQPRPSPGARLPRAGCPCHNGQASRTLSQDGSSAPASGGTPICRHSTRRSPRKSLPADTCTRYSPGCGNTRPTY